MAALHHYRATPADQLRKGWVKRFQPRLWTVDFSRPMMAALSNPAAGMLRVDVEFLTGSDMAGLVWASEDGWSHPLLGYATDRDYRGVTLAFDWVADAGLMPLDALYGPVLTIEGRDAAGLAGVWYVRLWNYVQAGRVTLDFDALRAGFAVGGEAVFAGDIDRMFISLVPAAFGTVADALPERVQAGVELRNLRATGMRSTIAIGDAFLPEHDVRMSSGYDDSYHLAPERLVDQWLALGYRALANHYVGMSHAPALAHVGGGRFEVSGGVCGPALAWHRAFLRAADAAGFAVILSLSFELFDANAPDGWAQRDADGERALTGWSPPSTLLSPCNAAAVEWLCGVAVALTDVADTLGMALKFQVGEPWWWVGPTGRPCFYDAATVARWVAETGDSPPVMRDVLGERSTAERLWLDWLGARLADATLAVVAAVRAGRLAAVESLLLFYAPQVVRADRPDLLRANMPLGWAVPAFDVLQLEDYDFVIAGDEGGMARGRAAVAERLGYAVTEQHYLSGFVLEAEDAGVLWPLIMTAADGAKRRGVAALFLWAWPQIARDGMVAFALGDEGDGGMDAFHDVQFPLEVGLGASGGPAFQTQVTLMASGHEQRNMDWANARLHFDAGIGIRSEADIQALLAFFRARRGQAHGFRFRDPLDHSSAMDGGAVSAFDQSLGVGDGQQLSFGLVKQYGAPGEGEARPIHWPVAGSVRVSVGGVELTEGWAVLADGVLLFDVAPAEGAVIGAGFLFDVPMRFAVDRLDVSLGGWRAGEVPSVPLVEIRQ